MDDNTLKIIDRIDKAVDDIFERLSRAMAEHRTEDERQHKEFDERLSRIEEAYYKTLGGAFVVGGIASWVIKKLGG